MKRIGMSFVWLFLPIFVAAQGQNENYQVYYYDNGNVSSEGTMINGQPDGYWKTYYPNGQLKSEGNRELFELDSLWIFYNEQGQKTTTISYDHGVKEGELVTYKNGVIHEIANFEDDVKSGLSVFLYPTGEVHKKIPYVEGEESGDGLEYARDGRVITLLTFKEGYLRSAEKINRYDASGGKRGPWIEFYSNGVIAEEGTYMNDLKNGIFKTYDRKGDLLTLEKYKNGELVTDSEQSVILDLRSTYYPDGSVQTTGGYVEGKKEGTHRFYNPEGEITGGVVYDRGEKVAEGIVDEKGAFQGMWKLYYDTGELKAEGEYVDSKRTGEWTFYHKNGETEHRAKYADGLPQGKWLWFFDNGNLRREEYYRRGNEDGPMVEYDIDGNIIAQGEYAGGYKEGEWFYHVGDHTEKGKYVSGDRSGTWIYEYPDGDLHYEGEYVAGMPVGKHRWYYPNGQVKKEGKYSSGIRVGTWRKYDEAGMETLSVKYKNGREFKINGKKVYYEEADAELTDI